VCRAQSSGFRVKDVGFRVNVETGCFLFVFGVATQLEACWRQLVNQPLAELGCQDYQSQDAWQS